MGCIKGLLVSFSCFCFLLLTTSCGEDEGIEKPKENDLNLGPQKVQVSKASGTWKLYKDGESFQIEAVAGSGYYDRVAEFGGNTIRFYGINDSTRTTMDRAHEQGLSIGFGLWMQQPEYGFDYSNPTLVKEQLDNLTAQVREYKDHPALLFWFLGNELDGHYEDNVQRQEMWEAVNDVCKMIHEEDPDHPTTIAIINSSVEKLLDMKKWVPDMDFFSSNAKNPQSGLVQAHMLEADWDMPYILSEYGNRALPQGFPEAPRLEWGGLAEPTSTEKAAVIKEIYQEDVLPNLAKGCIGSFAFLWGDQANHQTGSRRNWHSFFSEDGYSFGVVDEVQYGWTGVYPTNRAPKIEDRTKMTLNGLTSLDGIKLEVGKLYNAQVDADDIDPLTYEWIVVKEDAATGNRPPGLSEWVESSDKDTAKIRCKTKGAYRLYVSVKDDKGKMANAVIPFLVED